MSPEQKLQALEWSLSNAFQGLTTIVHCPYCDTDLDFSPISPLAETYDPPTCCAEFALGSIAILQRIEMMEAAEIAERIRQNTGGSTVFN